MRLLIDTQVLLWAIQGDTEFLPQGIRDLLIDPENDVFVSIASYWEIAIKQKNNMQKMADGKQVTDSDMPWKSSVQALEHLAVDQEMLTLGITTDAVEHTKLLPLDHKDPFDRIIAAAAVTAGMRLVSSDAAMDYFTVDRIWG